MSRQMSRQGRQIVAYSVTLAGLLGVLWWLGTPSVSEKVGVTVLAIDKTELQEVRYESESVRVALRAKEDAWGPYVDVEVERLKRPRKPANPHEVQQTLELEALAEPERTHFTGGPIAKQVFERFAPLIATRVLDAPPQDRLADFGLDAGTGKLHVTSAKETSSFEVGSPIEGVSALYLRSESDGRLLVVDAGLRQSFEFAEQRLAPTQIVDVPVVTVVAAELQVGSAAARFDQRDREDPTKAAWLRQGTPDDAASSWLSRLLTMRGSKFVAADQLPKTAVVRVTLRLLLEDRRVFEIELLEDPSAEDAPASESPSASAPPATSRWYGRSPSTRGALVLPSKVAVELVADAIGVVGG